MNRRLTKTTLVLAVLGAVCGLLLASSASASSESTARASIKPPSGTPDLSKMAVAVGDLAPGAKVRRQGYIRPEQGFVASYVREFRTGARLRSKRLLYLESDIELLRNVADAKLFYDLVKLFSGRIDPDELAADFSKESGLKVRYVRIGKAVSLRTGDQSFALTVRIGTRLGEFRVVSAVLRVDRVVAYVGIAGLPKVKVGTTEAKVLGRKVSRRISQGLLPVNRVLPAITGTAAVGQTLTASTGTWINQPSSYTYTWARCNPAGVGCTIIPGATTRTYVLTAADSGLTIRVLVRARNGRGAAVAISWPTQTVAGLPVNTVLPAISGTPAVGQTLAASPGSWNGGVTGYAYAWRRCNTTGADCQDILGATSQSYMATAADVGYTLRAAVTATNAQGSATAVSAQTEIVLP